MLLPGDKILNISPLFGTRGSKWEHEMHPWKCRLKRLCPAHMQKPCYCNGAWFPQPCSSSELRRSPLKAWGCQPDQSWSQKRRCTSLRIPLFLRLPIWEAGKRIFFSHEHIFFFSSLVYTTALRELEMECCCLLSYAVPEVWLLMSVRVGD